MPPKSISDFYRLPDQDQKKILEEMAKLANEEQRELTANNLFNKRLLEILPETKRRPTDFRDDNDYEVGWNECLREIRNRAGLDELPKQK